jgi:hypothetical protein
MIVKLTDDLDDVIWTGIFGDRAYRLVRITIPNALGFKHYEVRLQVMDSVVQSTSEVFWDPAEIRSLTPAQQQVIFFYTSQASMAKASNDMLCQSVGELMKFVKEAKARHALAQQNALNEAKGLPRDPLNP